MMLRELQIKDADGMIEWMQDEEIIRFFRMSRANICKEAVCEFIVKSFDEHNRHYAIVDEGDEYLGTISLKNIDLENSNAEYAIALRRQAIATGIAKEATQQLLEIAFGQLNLHKVYLNVLSNNFRAIKFYEKNKFRFEGEFKQHIKRDNEYIDLRWYAITKEVFNNGRV